MEPVQIELFVMVDESGDYAVHKDGDEIGSTFNDEIGSNGPRRLVKITLTVPLPVMLELTGDVPPESTQGTTLQVA